MVRMRMVASAFTGFESGEFVVFGLIVIVLVSEHVADDAIGVPH